MSDVKASAHWCTPEQFLRKCEDEIYKAVRYNVPFTVVTAKLNFINQGSDAAMAQFVESGLRQIDFAGKVAADRYALGLPFTASRGADVVAARLRMLLIEFSPIVGTACAPDEGTSTIVLLNNADRGAHEKAAALRAA